MHHNSVRTNFNLSSTTVRLQFGGARNNFDLSSATVLLQFGGARTQLRPQFNYGTTPVRRRTFYQKLHTLYQNQRTLHQNSVRSIKTAYALSTQRTAYHVIVT